MNHIISKVSIISLLHLQSLFEKLVFLLSLVILLDIKLSEESLNDPEGVLRTE